MASDPWDRRRWVNPRLDRVDSPQLLGLLNLLYDLLEKHGHVLDFPFPLRKPGAGVAGFAPKEPGDQDSDAKSGEVVSDPSPRRRRPARTMIED